MNYDLVIKDGTIIDGTGNPPYRSDIGIRNGKIIKIGRLIAADKVINGCGLIVVPGFIDPHSHSDFVIPFDSRLESTIRQGITTAVVGNCGDSLAPINPEKLELFEKMANIFSPPGEKLKITWQTYEEYLSTMEKGGCSTNVSTSASLH